jgi:rare lipoprotein A
VAALVITFLGSTHAPDVELAHEVDAGSHNWRVSEASWYGPGLHGRGTACGQMMSPDLQGVAHKSLPCGTLVRFEWHGTQVVVPVVDRGPYVRDREWDLTQATCERLGRCYTAAVASTL